MPTCLLKEHGCATQLRDRLLAGGFGVVACADQGIGARAACRAPRIRSHHRWFGDPDFAFAQAFGIARAGGRLGQLGHDHRPGADAIIPAVRASSPRRAARTAALKPCDGSHSGLRCVRMPQPPTGSTLSSPWPRQSACWNPPPPATNWRLCWPISARTSGEPDDAATPASHCAVLSTSHSAPAPCRWPQADQARTARRRRTARHIALTGPDALTCAERRVARPRRGRPIGSEDRTAATCASVTHRCHTK